jgi:ATP-dependent helicase/DNAse subunit B
VNVADCGDAVASLRLNGREVSASEVEALGACPYRHFLRVGLRLRPWEEPERTYALDRRDVGTIMHSVSVKLAEVEGGVRQ